jgi:antitoxin component of RelBE/YafQ-DinJ toxin-antitoxin module
MIMRVKMPKVPLNITVDKDILEKFKELCENNDIKISTKINTLMKEWINNNKK